MRSEWLMTENREKYYWSRMPLVETVAQDGVGNYLAEVDRGEVRLHLGLLLIRKMCLFT